MNQHIEQSTSDAAATLDGRTRELNEMLANRASEIGRVIDEKGRPLIDKFVESGGDLQKGLEAATQKATDKLRAENAALVNALASRTAETLAAMEGARVSLSGNVSELLDRLTRSNAQLGELVGLAEKNLGAIDGRLVETTHSFSASAEKAAETFSSSARMIDTNASRLAEVSSQTLSEVAAIANRFDEHGRLLAQARDMLGSAQSSLSTTMEERQAALEELSAGLVKKSEDIERMMRSFEGIVGKAMEKVEGRTIASTQQIRDAISEVIESATERFAGATEEIRRTAGAIKSELEDTRSELKRGVLQLPEEARESTGAIKRAVSEQIAALKELADVVAKSGRMYDVSTTRTIDPAPQPAAVTQQPTRPAPQQPSRPAPQARAPEPQSVAGPALRGTTSAEPAPAPAAPAGQQDGWVQNLLRRASQDETPAAAAPATAAPAQPRRSQSNVMESLNSLSGDIARAIDHEASVELWQRYRRGERNVFSRRLYTLKGQQTFDEIRRKYQSDADFRAAVDRYCEDFEKLLQDVARSDRDQTVTQTYLTSDTGKVYTMLAHASGRLR